MDFTQPDAPIDGGYRRVLFVRDLASGYVLLAQPCASECAAVARQALEQLFALHGPPLALKADNGGKTGSGSGAKRRCLTPLRLWPRHNGSCERGLAGVWLVFR